MSAPIPGVPGGTALGGPSASNTGGISAALKPVIHIPVTGLNLGAIFGGGTSGTDSATLSAPDNTQKYMIYAAIAGVGFLLIRGRM